MIETRFRSSLAGFTLIELLAVLVILAILGAFLFPALDSAKNRIRRAHCTSNLRSLHRGASAYIEDHGHWPQIPLVGNDTKILAKTWVTTLDPYGIEHKAWICPTIQELVGSPDYESEENFRSDYFGTPFDAKPRTPFLLTQTPWFSERGDMHGLGNLMVFGDGSVRDFKNVLAQQGRILPGN